MARFNKAVSAVVLACFLLNTAVSDLAFGQSLNIHTNSDKLANSSPFNNILQDPEITDLAHIEMWFGLFLNEFAKKNPKEITAENLIAFYLKNPNLLGVTSLQPKGADLKVLSINEVADVVKIKFQRKDNIYGSKGRIYWIEYSVSENKIIAAYRDGKRTLSQEEAAAKARYEHQQENIDRVLEWAHKNKAAKKPIGFFINLSSYTAFLKNVLNVKINNPNSLRIKDIEERELSLVNLEDVRKNMPGFSENLLTTKAIVNGKEIEIRNTHAHSSNRAISILIEKEIHYDVFMMEENDFLHKYGVSPKRYLEILNEAVSIVMMYISHEIGVMANLPIISGCDNELDLRYQKLLKRGGSLVDLTPIDEPLLHLNLVDLNTAPAILTRDYAVSGNAEPKMTETLLLASARQLEKSLREATGEVREALDAHMDELLKTKPDFCEVYLSHKSPEPVAMYVIERLARPEVYMNIPEPMFREYLHIAYANPAIIDRTEEVSAMFEASKQKQSAIAPIKGASIIVVPITQPPEIAVPWALAQLETIVAAAKREVGAHYVAMSKGKLPDAIQGLEQTRQQVIELAGKGESFKLGYAWEPVYDPAVSIFAPIHIIVTPVQSATPAAAPEKPGTPDVVVARITDPKSRLYQISNNSTLSYDPADCKDLLPDRIQWAIKHNFTEITFNPNNISSYIGYLVDNIGKYPEFAKEVTTLLAEGNSGVEFEHRIISYVIKTFLPYFNKVSYEVDADIESARFQSDWNDKPESERTALEEVMVNKTAAEIIRIHHIDPVKMFVKVPNTPVGHRAIEMVKTELKDTDINFTLFFSLEDSIKGLKNLGSKDVLSQFVSRIDALTQDKKNNIPLDSAQSLVGLIIAKQFVNYCKEHNVKTRIILASLGEKTKIPAWIYVYCLTGGKQIMTMPYAQGASIESDASVPDIKANLEKPMEEFLLPFVMHPECIKAAHDAGFWMDYAKDSNPTEEQARDFIKKAVNEWNHLDQAIKDRIYSQLASEGYKKFYDPFANARAKIQALEKQELAKLKKSETPAPASETAAKTQAAIATELSPQAQKAMEAIAGNPIGHYLGFNGLGHDSLTQIIGIADGVIRELVKKEMLRESSVLGSKRYFFTQAGREKIKEIRFKVETLDEWKKLGSAVYPLFEKCPDYLDEGNFEGVAEELAKFYENEDADTINAFLNALGFTLGIYPHWEDFVGSPAFSKIQPVFQAAIIEVLEETLATGREVNVKINIPSAPEKKIVKTPDTSDEAKAMLLFAKSSILRKSLTEQGYFTLKNFKRAIEINLADLSSSIRVSIKSPYRALRRLVDMGILRDSSKFFSPWGKYELTNDGWNWLRKIHAKDGKFLNEYIDFREIPGILLFCYGDTEVFLFNKKEGECVDINNEVAAFKKTGIGSVKKVDIPAACNRAIKHLRVIFRNNPMVTADIQTTLGGLIYARITNGSTAAILRMGYEEVKIEVETAAKPGEMKISTTTPATTAGSAAAKSQMEWELLSVAEKILMGPKQGLTVADFEAAISKVDDIASLETIFATLKFRRDSSFIYAYQNDFRTVRPYLYSQALIKVVVARLMVFGKDVIVPFGNKHRLEPFAINPKLQSLLQTREYVTLKDYRRIVPLQHLFDLSHKETLNKLIEWGLLKCEGPTLKRPYRRYILTEEGWKRVGLIREKNADKILFDLLVTQLKGAVLRVADLASMVDKRLVTQDVAVKAMMKAYLDAKKENCLEVIISYRSFVKAPAQVSSPGLDEATREQVQKILSKTFEAYGKWTSIDEFINEMGLNSMKGLEYADGKAAFVFSPKATFGCKIGSDIEPGLGPLLMIWANSGIPIAVITENEHQEKLIEELNIGISAEKRIRYGANLEVIKPSFAKQGIARYYYLKTFGEQAIDGVKGVRDIIVRHIIEAIGEVRAITENLGDLLQAAKDFAQSA